jgi:hypothetical protein
VQPGHLRDLLHGLDLLGQDVSLNKMAVPRVSPHHGLFITVRKGSDLTPYLP